MDGCRGKLINIIATGFIVLVLFSLVLFWGRFLCFSSLIGNMPSDSRRIIIQPSGLVPGEPAIKRVKQLDEYSIRNPDHNEPDVQFSWFRAYIEPDFVSGQAIGAFQDMQAFVNMSYNVNERVYYWYSNEGNYLCFDNRSGLLINRFHYKVNQSTGEIVNKTEDLFAGPNGVSRTADSSLGRFSEPLIGSVTGGYSYKFWLYDRKYRQFYFVDLSSMSVSKGLRLAEADNREPIAIETICANGFYDGIGWSTPRIRSTLRTENVFLPGNSQSNLRIYCAAKDCAYSCFPVLDKTGRVFIYNLKEQTLTSAGYLPKPESLFAAGSNDNTEIARPADVLAYKVLPIYTAPYLFDGPNRPQRAIDTKYLGMSVACVSREGTAMALAVFDPNGKLIYRGNTTTSDGASTARAVYSGKQGVLLTTAILFVFEEIQSPVFEIASYLCGDYFEAAAGHRALFILPNSFAGMLSRVSGEKLSEKPVLVLMLMGPSLVLSVWLAWRVRKNAMLTGLSGTAKIWWTIGTIAFGLPAYITYRLTRSKETMVTCQNCGKMRRPDMERCHRCGGKWEIPELTPPNWRIYN